MKKLIAIAAGLVVCQQAAAYTSGLEGADITVTISGATASESALRDMVDSKCLDNANKHVFLNGNDIVVSCDTDNSFYSGISAGTQHLVVRKNGTGGSGNGVAPVCNGSTVGFMPVDDTFIASCSPTASATDPAYYYSCPAFTADPEVPNMGISDVAPTEVLSGASANCGTGTGAFVRASFATVFGVPVTTKLRDALQVAQGIRDSSAAIISGDKEDVGNMPSISKEQYVSLIAGRVKKWDEFLVEQPGGTEVALTAVPGVTGPGTNTSANRRVSLVRRVATSGTFAASQVKMAKVSCIAGAVGWPDSLSAPVELNGPILMPLQSGSNDVSTCLTNLNGGDTAGTDNAGVYTAGTQTACASKTGTQWAIGMQSLDKDPLTDSAGRKGYRFVKLNGYAPTFENVAKGLYPFWVTSTVQRAPDAVADPDGNGTSTNPPTGDAAIVADIIATEAANPDVVGVAGRDHTFGRSGIAALAENGYAVRFLNGEFDGLEPVIPYTHAPGGTQSNCLEAGKVTAQNALLP